MLLQVPLGLPPDALGLVGREVGEGLLDPLPRLVGKALDHSGRDAQETFPLAWHEKYRKLPAYLVE